MSVQAFENSRNRGSPASLFEFTYGDAPINALRYTNADLDVSFDGEMFTRETINHESVKSKGRGESVEVKVNVAASSPIAQLFKGGTLRRVVYLKIYKGHVVSPNDPSSWGVSAFEPHWYGRVMEHSRKGTTVILSCSTLGAGMQRPALGTFYQRSCQHVLYGLRCGADKTAATVATTVVSTGVNSLTVASGWEGGFTGSNFIGGMVEWDGIYGREVRSILGVNGDTFTLDANVDELSASDAVDVVLGCPHTLAGCGDLHSNLPNYGGMPYIPLTNPVNQNNHT